MTGGKQYVAQIGKHIKVEKLLPKEKGGDFEFDKVLLMEDENKNVIIGKPFIEGAKIIADIIKEGKNKKITILRYHSKTRYRKKKGYRQPYTEVVIKDITISSLKENRK